MPGQGRMSVPARAPAAEGAAEEEEGRKEHDGDEVVRGARRG
jgi:hypothetical protein